MDMPGCLLRSSKNSATVPSFRCKDTGLSSNVCAWQAKQMDRKLNLTGEAFFEVAPDTSLPFIIAAANTQVRVVGTSFLVKTDNDQVELVVKTGKVQFSNAVSQILQRWRAWSFFPVLPLKMAVCRW